MTTARSAAVPCLCALLPVVLASCGFGKEIHLYDQARTIALELASASRGLLPRDYGEEDVGVTYDSDPLHPAASGSATATGGYSYDYAYYSTDSTSRREDRTWSYDSIAIRYRDFKSDDANDVAIVSGSIVVHGTQSMSTRYTGSFYSDTTESGSVSLSGTVTIEGVCEGEDVRDTVDIDLVYEWIGTAWFYNGTISNSRESFDIVYE